MRNKWLHVLLAVLVVAAFATLAQAMFGNLNWFTLQDTETYTPATWQAWNASEEAYTTGQGYAVGTTTFPQNNYWTSGWYETNDTFDTWYDSGPTF